MGTTKGQLQTTALNLHKQACRLSGSPSTPTSRGNLASVNTINALVLQHCSYFYSSGPGLTAITSVLGDHMAFFLQVRAI